MNTNNIKKYAPQARRAFISAVMKRLNELGIYSDKQIADASIQGQLLLIEGRSFDISIKNMRDRLINKVQRIGFLNFVEHIAYTWFNRLCAIRFMELKSGYLEHGLRVLSHPEKTKGFEILDHAQDVAEQLGLDRSHIVELKLAGNKDEELYRHLLLGQCHQLHKAMPFLFEALDDETELLLPDNLTRTDSILRSLVDGIPEEDWLKVEIIGWLYQFYISEKKDQVIGKVVKSEDIPAATQLFTPNWIVKYLVQNSVGRQWLMTYPDSSLKGLMEYYIEPAEQDATVGAALAAITPGSIEPESIKVLDPACGSGHILVEAYNLLKAIYEERGYRSRDIPKLILENNLFGLDIDDRAAQLAGFALMMKAREDDRRIFTRDLKLNVCAIQSTQGLNLPELWRKLDLNKDTKRGMTESIFDDAQTHLADVLDNVDFNTLQSVLVLFEQAKTFGSLIQVPADKAEFLHDLTNQLHPLAEHGDSFQKPAAASLLPFVQQAWLLAQRYDVVVANPPYMGSKGMNSELKAFAQKHFPDSKSDLFAMFMERAFDLLNDQGYNAQVNMQSWMFLSSYQAMREKLLDTHTFITMAHLGARAFGQISGEVVQTTAFVLAKNHIPYYQPTFFRLINGNEDVKRIGLLNKENAYTQTKQDDFKKILGGPISYWVSDKFRSIFTDSPALGKVTDAAVGLQTGNNDGFLRLWHEVDLALIGFNMANREQAQKSGSKWFPYNKGGAFRKWYGNHEYVVDWWNDGENIRQDKLNKLAVGLCRPGNSTPHNTDYYFRSSVSWSDITSSNISFRFFPFGFIHDVKGQSAFFLSSDLQLNVLRYCNNKFILFASEILNPSVSFQVGNFNQLPYPKKLESHDLSSIKELVSIAKLDWNSFESSWDFFNNSLISNKQKTIETSYLQWLAQNREAIIEMQRLEQENNSLFIEAYDMQDELEPDVPLEQITLIINKKYRYGGNLSDEELTRRFKFDTLAELISYAIGCMMGRYRLDKPGLIYAHAGNIDFDEIYNKDSIVPTLQRGNAVVDALASRNAGALQTEFPRWSVGTINSDPLPQQINPFSADDDGIIPLTDQEWFKDDATNRFREFVRTVWDEEGLHSNLNFVAESLCLTTLKPKKSESSIETIRRYLSTQFYKDHLKTYKKRPIYWLFSSGKQKAFECLVYLHRYNESTLSRMRTGYVTPLLGKYDAFADQLNRQIEDATTSEAMLLKKELLALEKKQTELREFDDKLKHYADMRIKLDLDDGVKVNYGKFGDLLAEVKAITGGKE